MNNEHIKLGFVKTKPIELLKNEFFDLPLELIQSIEKEYQNKYESALLKEARIENFTGNVLKAIFILALIIIMLITINWYFTPFTFDKLVTGIFWGAFIAFPIFIMSFISYLLTGIAVSETIKHVFFFKQTKLLEKLRKEKAYLDYQKREQKKRLNIEKQQNIKNKMDSIHRDIETIGKHFADPEHTPLLGKSKLENSVSDILNTITEWAIHEVNRKDKSDSYKNNEIENYKKLIFLLAHVEEDQIVESVNKLAKLMSLADPNDTNSEFSKSLVKKIANFWIDNPKASNHMSDAFDRYQKFLIRFNVALTT